MASIIPLDNRAFTTPGERRFYAFLKDSVKPDSHCLAWYAPSVDGLEPDFVLYTPEEGLIVFEVKDWVLSQIRAADIRSVTLALTDGREESRRNPMQQGRDYVFAILNRIRVSCKRLLSTEPRYKGKPRLPVQCGLVFSNITRDEFMASKLNTVLPADKILFADDLALAAVQNDSAAFSKLRKQFAAMFPPQFPFRLTSEDVSALRELLWPQVRITLPRREGNHPSPEDDAAGLRLLDAQQESLARRLDAVRAVIEGPAGSGKSIVLIAKAVQTYTRLRQSGSDLPVLVVCFNLTLVHYLKRMLAGQNTRLGRKNIQVTHFYEFCRSLLHEPLNYENEGGSYYELVTRVALESDADTPRYGAIFVDEGQDFSDDMLAVLRKHLAPDGMFWIALDSAQQLYDIPKTWLEDKELRRFTLRSPYRATRQLTKFCELLMGRGLPDAEENHTPSEFFAVRNTEGEAPRLIRIADIFEGVKHMADRIRYLHDRGVPYSEMVILYASRKFEGLDDDLPLFLQDALEEEGILASWPSRDARGKAGWDITADSVTISTIHSMKGMDAEAIFIIGLDALKTSHAPDANPLVYVACTRARRFLDILHTQETALITFMQKAVEICRSE